MKAYKLLKPFLGLPVGTVFVHDKKDRETGSIAYGSLKLAWDNGNTQHNCPWCGGTYIIPGEFHLDTEWFEKIKNKRIPIDDPATNHRGRRRFHL
jgi:hypothetical protein